MKHFQHFVHYILFFAAHIFPKVGDLLQALLDFIDFCSYFKYHFLLYFYKAHTHNMTRHYRHTLEFFQTCEKREKYYCFVILLFVFAHNKDENLWALDVPSTLYIACKLYAKKRISYCIISEKTFSRHIVRQKRLGQGI